MRILRLFDYIFVLRPMLHLPVWTIVILGYYSHDHSRGGDWSLLYSLIIASCLFGAVFVLNQIYDIESDRLNRKLHFLPDGHIKIGTAWIMTVCLNLAALTGSFRISLEAGLISLSIVILGILYSVPTAALKNRAWQAVFANGLGHGTLVFVLGFLTAGGSVFAGFWKSLPYFLAVIAVYAGTTLPDVGGDAKAGKNTLAVVYGQVPTIYILSCCFVLALCLGYVLNDILFLIAGLASAPYYFLSCHRKDTAHTVLAVKISIISLSFAAVYVMPFYFLIATVLVVATRAYYRARFGVVYPSIK